MAKPVHVPGVPKGFAGLIIEICASAAGAWSFPHPGRYLRVIARNRQILLVSQLYPSLAHARRAAKAFAKHIPDSLVVVNES